MSNRYSPYRHVTMEASNSGSSYEGTDADKAQRDLFRQLFEFPSRLSTTRSERPKDVCVIGGGIAGLAAAYELAERDNVRVTLLEASDRFGGRIRTHRFYDGTYGELGAMRVPEDHGCVRHYVETFGLPTRPFVTANHRAFFHLRGLTVQQGNWSDLLGLYPNLKQSEQENYQANSPDEASSNLTFKDIPASIVSPRLFGELLKDFEVPEGPMQLFEALSVGQVLRETPEVLGMSLGLSGLPGNARSLSDEAYQILGSVDGAAQFEHASFLAFFLTEKPIMDSGKYELEGGMGALVDAFVARLRGNNTATLRTRARVQDIKSTGHRVEVAWQSGPEDRKVRRVHQFDYVVCTAPAQPTAAIGFDPPLRHPKREALANLYYASAAKTIVRCERRHWELVDGIYGGGSYTDMLIQQCWYPSDNSEEDPGDGTLRAGPDDSFQETGWRAKDESISHEPGVFIGAYMWEGNARRFAAMTEAERTDTVVASLEKMHEDIGDAVEDVVHCVWDAESNPGHGAFACFAPGQQRRYQAALCEPWPYNRNGHPPRVFFAGEHVAVMHGWIQSALQSALTAVEDVLNAP